MKRDIVTKVVIIGLISNIVLTIIKLVSGYLGNSPSLISDGINSLADIFVSVLILVVIKISGKKPDKNHPYGHEKYEGVIYLVLSMIILLTGAYILITAGLNLIDYFNNQIIIIKPSSFTTYISALALLIKTFLYIITSKTAKKYQSSSLKGDAKNHLVDILATSVSLISLVLASFNILYFETIASIIISVVIIYTAITMGKEAISFLVDEAPPKEVMNKIRETIKEVNGVITIDLLKARKHMNHFYTDVEISVSSNLSLIAAHEIAEDVRVAIEERFKAIHCMVHVNPEK